MNFFRNKIGRCVAILTSTSLVLLGAACGGASPTADSEDFTMRVTVTPGIGSMPFKAALENGYFEDNGLKVEVTEGYDFDSYLAALDRQFDAAMLVATSTVLAGSGGLPMKAYAGMEAAGDKANMVVIVTKKPELKTLEDLADAGAKVGVLEPGELTTVPWQMALSGTDADAEDIEQVGMSFPDMMGQLEAGRVDAVQAAAGFYEPLLDQGYEVIYRHPQEALVEAGAELPSVFAHFVSSDRFMAENLDEAQAFQKAIGQGIDWVEANPEDAYAMFAEWVGRDVESVKSIEMPEWKLDVEASDFEAWATIMRSGGLVKDDFDSSSLIADGM